MADNPLGLRSFATDDEETMGMFEDEQPDDEVGGEQEVPEDQPPALDEPEVEEDTRQFVEEEEGEEESLVEGEVDEEEVDRLAEEYAGQFADTFRTVGELEDGYKEVRSAFTRVAQEASTHQQRMEELQKLNEEQQGQIDGILEFMQQQMAENDPEFAEELQRRLAMQEELQAQVQPLQEQLEQERVARSQQQQVQQMQAQAAQVVAAFYDDHEDIQPGSPEDNALTRIYAQVDQGLYEGTGGNVRLDPTNREHLELVYEISQNPQLGAEVLMSPLALKVPGGVARLRERAGATIAATEQPPRDNGQGRSRGPVRRRVEGFVETGTGGAPGAGAPGEAPKDEFDEAWDWYNSTHNQRGPLFGSKRT
jgi:hypothetical protein